MKPLSDILVMFTKSLEAAEMDTARRCLMETGVSVLIHQKEGQSRVLLVKFDPRDVTTDKLLAAVHSAGFDARMVSG